MIFVLICTEGDVSEPAYIEALSAAIGGQAPRNVSANVEVLPIPLSGNQGHAKLIAAADAAIAKHSKEGLVGIAGSEDQIEKWIIVDHDDMESNGVDACDLRKQAEAAGYTLVVNKPNFEYFVLSKVCNPEKAITIKRGDFIEHIDSHINELNTQNQQKGFSDIMAIPPYSKKRFVAPKFFGLLLDRHPELISKAAELEVDTTQHHYTEMPKIINRISELYG